MLVVVFVVEVEVAAAVALVELGFADLGWYWTMAGQPLIAPPEVDYISFRTCMGGDVGLGLTDARVRREERACLDAALDVEVIPDLVELGARAGDVGVYAAGGLQGFQHRGRGVVLREGGDDAGVCEVLCTSG